MKRLLVVLLMLAFAGTALGQGEVTLGIANARVEAGEFKWEVTLTRTSAWWTGNNVLGTFDFQWDINHSAFNTGSLPVVTNIYSGIDNASYTLTSRIWFSGNTRVKILFTWNEGPGSWTPDLNELYELYTVSVQISDGNNNAGLSYNPNTEIRDESGLMLVMSYTGATDMSLPVNMSNFTADRLPKQGIQINWTMESQDDAAEFNMFRSGEMNGDYARINNIPIEVQEGSGTASYSFLDTDVTEGEVYFYKIQEVLFSGTSVFYGPIEAIGVAGLPSEITLAQNYPNPFNPGTTISYSLPEKSHVTMKIYNVFGREVRVLVNQEQDAGYFPVEWDGTDHTGRNAATGIYYCRLSAGGTVQTRKMIKIQ